MKIKDEFHQLIDEIEDERLLDAYYKLFQRLRANETGVLWNRLSNDQQIDLLLTYEESFDPNNLIDHELVRKQHEQWLKR